MESIRCNGRKILLDEKFMEKAISAALLGIRKGRGPFGAAIVDFDGKMISCATNSVVQTPSPTKHAEVNAIDQACRKLKTYVLDRHLIYSTTEPCLMCRGAIYWAHIPIIVYGTDQKDARVLGFDEINISDAQYRKIGKRKIIIVKHFMRKEALGIFRQFRKLKGQMY